MRTIDPKEFRQLRSQHHRFEEKREEVIQQSRRIINLSKQIIFSLQREDAAKATGLLPEIRKLMAGLPREAYDTGIQQVAQQEYVEAMCFHSIAGGKQLPSQATLKVDFESYLLGLCDLTGELVRKAVLDAVRGRPEKVQEAHDLVEQLYAEFLEFDLRNGELRKKSDSIKWNLKKLDELLYDLSRR